MRHLTGAGGETLGPDEGGAALGPDEGGAALGSDQGRAALAPDESDFNSQGLSAVCCIVSCSFEPCRVVVIRIQYPTRLIFSLFQPVFHLFSQPTAGSAELGQDASSRWLYKERHSRNLYSSVRGLGKHDRLHAQWRYQPVL